MDYSKLNHDEAFERLRELLGDEVEGTENAVIVAEKILDFTARLLLVNKHIRGVALTAFAGPACVAVINAGKDHKNQVGHSLAALGKQVLEGDFGQNDDTDEEIKEAEAEAKNETSH